jgi:membrane-associated protein
MALLCVAAILGDNTNYAIGRFAGSKVVALKFRGRNLVKQAYIDKTHSFFEKYGTKAIIMARFVPIVRTFTPFVAGVGQMSYRSKFLPYDVAGGVLWISSMSLSGYFLGNLPFFQEHFEAVVLGIILLSVMPMVVAFVKHKLNKS